MVFASVPVFVFSQSDVLCEALAGCLAHKTFLASVRASVLRQVAARRGALVALLAHKGLCVRSGGVHLCAPVCVRLCSLSRLLHEKPLPLITDATLHPSVSAFVFSQLAARCKALAALLAETRLLRVR